jgi:hypothetical protein
VQPSIKRGLDFVTENDNNIHVKSIYFLLNQKYDEIDLTCKEDIKKIFDKGMNNEKKNTFSDVLKVLSIIEDRVNTEDVKKCANMIKVIYTAYLTAYREGIEINDRNKEIQYRKFIGDYIWGEMEIVDKNKKQADLMTSRIPIDDPYSLIHLVRRDNIWVGDEECPLESEVFENCNVDDICKYDEKSVEATEISSYVQNKEFILFWILVGLIVDTKNDETIIADNRKLADNCKVSIENYIYGLSDLDGLYRRLNLNSIGCKEEDFMNVVNEIKNLNEECISCAQYIASSMDIMLELVKYCNENKNPIVASGEYLKKRVEEEYPIYDCIYDSVMNLFKDITNYMKEKCGFKFNNRSLYKLRVKINNESEIRTCDMVGIYSGVLRACFDIEKK